MSAQKRNKKPAKQPSAPAQPTQEQQQVNSAASQTSQAQADNNKLASGGVGMGTNGGGGAQIAESQAHTPEANPVLHLLYLADALQRENISPEVGNLVLSNLGDRIMGMVGQLNAASGLLQQLGSLRIDPSKAQIPSLEERLKQVQEVQKHILPGMSMSMEIPEGLNPFEVEQYNRAIEALMANVAAQLAAQRSMLGQQLSRLLSYARQADALINSPGYVHPEELPGSIVHGRSPLDVQLINYGGIPEQDDSGEWKMRPGLGIQAIFYQAPPRLDLPPLQLPKEFPKPPKPSEFKVSLSRERPSGSKTPLTWKAARIDTSNVDVVNPIGEHRYANTETISNLIGQVGQLNPNDEARQSLWMSVSEAVRTFLVGAPKGQAEELARRQNKGGRDVAIGILREAVRRIPVYDSVDDALRSSLKHGGVFYVPGRQGGFYFLERSLDGKPRAHRFEDILSHRWVRESKAAFDALAKALINVGNIVNEVLTSNNRRYANALLRVVGVDESQGSAIAAYAEQLVMGLFRDDGRDALASALFSDIVDPRERINAFWNTVIQPMVNQSRQPAGRQSSQTGGGASSPGRNTGSQRKQSDGGNKPGGTGGRSKQHNDDIEIPQ